MGILIKNSYIMSMTDSIITPIKGDILIEDDRLALIGEVTIEQAEAAHEVIDATGMIAMPGLINCHNHASMSLLRGFSEDMRLMDWLSKKMWPAEARMDENDVYLGTLLAAVEMIKSGTTTFNDMYIYMDSVAQAVNQSGIRAVLTRGLIDIQDSDKEKRFNESRELFEKWHRKGDGRITAMVGPHGPHTCPPEYMKRVIELAKEQNVPIHIHLAETTEEVNIMKEKYNMTPTEYLKEMGLLDHHLVLAHSVHVFPSDLELLVGMKGGVSHNPVSNLKLGCGIAPIKEYLDAGITVGLGTDGPGSCTTLDMFEEIKAAGWMQKVKLFDPTALNASQLLGMATREGAKLLALAETVGTLEVGKKADLILINCNAAHLTPHTDLAALLAYGANGADVHTTIVNGKILMKNRKLMTVDEQALIEEINARAAKIVEGI